MNCDVVLLAERTEPIAIVSPIFFFLYTACKYMNFFMLHGSFIIRSGLIFPHDYFGTHLDDNENKIDKQLQVRNLKGAGRLAEHGMLIVF